MESTPPNLAGLSALRPATGSDAPLLAALWRRAWASANPLVAEVAPLTHWLERVHAEFCPPCLTLLGVHDGTATAFMVLDVEAAHLHQLFVDPGAQGTGIGAALVAHVCALCPQGWSLHVASTNLRARRFYARYGLQEHGHNRHPITGRERVLCRWQA
ncbi:GNAT family N-acetyltransferase [Acidovorax sp. Root219]|uniref:GNAT family N-acetyltransferase n=1 Tax=Acidovorax sp. Root219 TaxID=1736493 RepID=UPI00070F8761|nr:GNAT family N-acetyltransferase [Acidovorax sp. Root219]KRC28733.1 GCN5 family acetyltransferase [Acidovorax sp. Root219]